MLQDLTEVRHSQSPRSAGSHPVWDGMHDELERDGEIWLSDLARWYEADWLLAVEGGPQPSSSHVLEMLVPEKRERLVNVLSSIDSRYLPLIAERDRKTVRGGDEATIDLVQHRTNEVSPARLTPSNSQQREGDARELKGQASSQAAIDRAADPVTTDFSLGESERTQALGSKNGGIERRPIPHLPGYRMQRELGRGGMGVVYLAHQEGIDRAVAIKLILGGNLASKNHIERFKAEARAVGRLQHENIVRIYDIGWHHEMPYFSLEYVDGPSLSEKIDGKPIDPLEAIKIAIPLASSLAYAHDAGIVHRDLKPANVLLTRQGVPKLTDFGLAKQLETENNFSKTGDIVGTPGYMAPEQARGEKDVGPSADIYGLGAILYCMLSGRPPFMAAKVSDTIIQMLTQEPVSVARLQPGVSRDLETICMKCLEKEPRNRYSSSAELLADLERLAVGEPIAARPVSKAERAWRWAKRKPLLAGLSTTAATLGLTLMIGGPTVATVISGQKAQILEAKTESDENARQSRIAEAKADENAKLAAANAAEAKKYADAAQEQQKQAVDALKSLVFEVQRELKDRPKLQGIREALLDVARAGLARMEKVSTDVQAQNIIAASIYRRLGDINIEVGRTSAAQAEYRKCLDTMLALKAQNQLPGERHNLSTIYDLLGDASRKAGKLDEARKSWELCLEQRRMWVKETNGGLDQQQNVAAVLGKLSMLARSQGNLKQARQFLEEVRELRLEYVRKRPGELDPQEQLLGTNRELALLKFHEGNREDAMREMERVVEEFGTLASRNPDSQAFEYNSAVFRADLATLQLYDNRLSEAVANYSNSLEVQSRLANDDPEKLQLSLGVANTAYGLATAYLRQGKSAESQASYDRALAIQQAALDIDPENRARKIKVALFQARSGKIKNSLALAQSLVGMTDREPSQLYDLACVFALLSEAKSDHSAVGSAQREHAQTAIRLLKEAIARGFDRPTDLRFDPDLDPLRSNPEFGGLLPKSAPENTAQ